MLSSSHLVLWMERDTWVTTLVMRLGDIRDVQWGGVRS